MWSVTFWIVWATGAYIVATSAVKKYLSSGVKPTKDEIGKIALMFILSWVGLYYDYEMNKDDFNCSK